MGTTAGWQLWWAELSILVGLGAISVFNLYVQGGMRLQYVAWLALALALYDIIFATVLPLTDELVAGYLAHPLDPLMGMRFGIDNYGVGLGDLLVYSLFLVASHKAYGAKAARIAFGLILVFGALVTAFIPFALNFFDTELDLLIPSQALFGPAAFRTALEQQALIALMIIALAAAAWMILRARRPAGAASPEPPGRRLLRIGFGLVWLFDGLLQAQPGMLTGLVPQVIEPTALSSPPWVLHLVNWGTSIWTRHPVPAGTAAVWIEVGLGLWLLAVPHGPLSRLAGLAGLAGLASVGWGLVVWVFGESFGGLFAPGLSWLTGAPGAVLVYVAVGALLALPARAWLSPRLGQLTMGGLGLLLAVMAGVQARPGTGFWQGRSSGQPGTLAAMVRSMTQTPQPGFLSGWVSGFGAFDESHGFAVNLVVVVALTLMSCAFLSGRPRLIRPALAGFAVLGLADWVLVQDLGFLGGTGTDPNSMIPFILLATGGYLALTRVQAVPQAVAAPSTLAARS